MSLNANEMGQAMYDHVAEGKNPDATTKSLAEDSMKKMAAGIVEHLEGNFEVYHDTTLEGLGTEDDPLTVVGGGGGLQEVTHDATLSGQGTTDSPLTVLDSPHADTADSATNVSGVVAIANGGTGQDSASEAFDALSPLTTRGDLLVGGVGGTGSRLGIGDSGQVLLSDGTDPVWGDIPSFEGSEEYLSNGRFETSTAGWVTYADAAQATPENGTGGSPTVTFTRNTTAPLFGVADGLFTKDAANRLGQGVSADFTIDSGMLGEPVWIDFTYKVSSGTFTTGDLGIYIYDVTNSVLIPTSEVNLISADPSIVRATTNFLPSSSSTSYRLIFHVQSITTNAFAIQLDEVKINRERKLLTNPIGGWVSYTPNITGCGNCTNIVFNYRRIGTSIEVFGTFTTGTVAGSGGGVGLPSGLTLTNDVASLTVGQWSKYLISTSVDKQGAMCASYATYTNIVAFAGGGYATNNPPNTTGTWVSTIFSNSQNISVYFTVPIAQWTSNINLATDFTEYASNTSTADADDSTSFYNGSDGASAMFNFTSSRSRRIRFTRQIQPTDLLFLEFFDSPSGTWMQYNGQISLGGGGQVIVAGDYASNRGAIMVQNSSYPKTDVSILFYQYRNATQAWSNGMTNLRWRVRKISNGNMAEVPTIVRADYLLGTAPTVTAGTGVIINFDTKVEDTHNAVTTGVGIWKFTVPIAGVYLVNSFIRITGSTSSTVNDQQLRLYKNGVNNDYLDIYNSSYVLNSFYLKGNTTIRLNVGDYIHLYYGNADANSHSIQSNISRITITWLGK